MNHIAKNTGITFVSQVMVLAGGIISSVILARALGPGGKGIYALLLLIPAVLTRLGTAGIEVSNIYYTSAKKYRTGDIISTSLISGVLLGFFIVLLFWYIARLDVVENFLWRNRINHCLLWMVLIAIPFIFTYTFMNSIILGKENVATYNMLNVFQRFLQVAILLILVAWLSLKITGAVLSYSITMIISSFIAIAVLKKAEPIKFYFDKDIFRDSIRYGSKAYLGNIAQFLNYRLDILLIALFLNPAAIGYYSISVSLCEKLWMIPSSVSTVLFPRISSLDAHNATVLTTKVARNNLFLLTIISVVLAILARPVITILFGKAFLPSAKPLLILLPGIVALSISKILTSDMAGRGMPQYGTYASSASLVANVSLNLYLIPRWGIEGAATASSVAYILATFIVVMAFKRISQTRLRSVFLISLNDLRSFKDMLRKIGKEST